MFHPTGLSLAIKSIPGVPNKKKIPVVTIISRVINLNNKFSKKTHSADDDAAACMVHVF